jgi:hypothetical protein
VFEIIEGGLQEQLARKKEKREKSENAFYRQYINNTGFVDRAGFLRCVFGGVKYIVLSDIPISMADISDNGEETRKIFRDICHIDAMMAFMTPHEFETMFPIIKVYDGEKYGMKDYFSVRESIDKLPPHKILGTNLDMLLMEYYNSDINIYQVKKFMIVDRLRRLEGRRSMMEEFADHFGVPTYTYDEERKTMTNNDTGEVMKVHQPIPRGLQLIQGGQSAM